MNARRPAARHFDAPEILETRIAPAAVYYISGSELKAATLFGTSTVNQTGDTTAAGQAGADLALLLSAGDSIVFDIDGTPSSHATDYKWINVVAGKALVFFTDLDGSGGFSLDELTGLAVGDKFNGTVNGDVNGSVATMLDASGHFTPTTLQFASIAKLTVTGAIATDTSNIPNAHLFAGAGMSNISVGKSYFGHQLGMSVQGSVATGDAAQDLLVSFNGGGTSLTDDNFSPGAGAAGGDINNAHFSGAVGAIAAGSGQDNTKGAGGAGGSIVNVTLGAVDTSFFSISTGHGGSATDKPGAGGNGGKINGFTGTLNGPPFIIIGAGGDGIDAVGGNGGGIADSSFRLNGAYAFDFAIETGAGGNSTGKGNGGAGGGIINSSFQILKPLGTLSPDADGNSIYDSPAGLSLTMGDGGYAAGTGTGGAGGSFDWFFTKKNPLLLNSVTGGTNAAVNVNELASFTLVAGEGGGSGTGSGGAGGEILGGVFNFKRGLGEMTIDPTDDTATTTTGTFLVSSGAGGTGMVKGGDAGRVQGGVFNFLRPVNLTPNALDAFVIQGRDGGNLKGDAGGMSGAGDGGDVKQLIVNLQGGFSSDDYSETLAIRGGHGGDGGTNIGGGGDGGEINGLALLSPRPLLRATISGGDGGDAGTAAAGKGAGGAGGSLSNFLIQAASSSGGFNLHGGSGGSGFGTGAGGNGGDVNAGVARTVFTPAPLTDAALAAQLHTTGGLYVSGGVGSIDVTTGDGGDGGSGTATANGGNAGSILTTKIVTGAIDDHLIVTAGSGGEGNGAGVGGMSAKSDGLSIQVNGGIGLPAGIAGNLDVTFGHVGAGQAAGKDGATRNVDNLTVSVSGWVTDHVSIIAPEGLSEGGVSTAGSAGGSFNNLRLDIGDIGSGDSATAEVLLVRAGSGGTGKLGAMGGSINNANLSVGSVEGSGLIAAGDAGTSTGGAGTQGGSIIKSTFVFHDLVGVTNDFDAMLSVQAGFGGDGGSAKADGTGGFVGGAGGSITGSTVVTADVNGSLGVSAGNAGSSHGGTGPNGGALTGVTVENTGYASQVAISGGTGSHVDQGVGSKGGNGGAIAGSTYINQGGYDFLYVYAGAGGAHFGAASTTSGDAGAGGALTGFVFENSDSYQSYGTSLSAGSGGHVFTSGATAAGNGGAGGAVTGFVLHQAGDQYVSISGGSGGQGQGGKKGGDGGAVTGAVLDTYGSVDIYAGYGGDVLAATSTSVSNGGAGGLVSNVIGHVELLDARGGAGGSAKNGKGGLGGSIDTVTLAYSSNASVIGGGDGGNGVTGGGGGSISKITLPGDIGFFDGSTYGGLIAGRAGTSTGAVLGTNGSIQTVTADRISAIYAGSDLSDFDPTKATHAVTFIKSVIANVIGADVVGVSMDAGNPVDEDSTRGFGTFTFDDVDHSGAFSAGDGIIDGFVFVKASGLTTTSLSNPALKVFTI